MYTRTLILCVVICNTYINGENTTDAPWTVLPNMDNFCPGADVCRRNASNLKQNIVYEDGFTACCRDCSCEDDCGLNGSCCFPELDKYNTIQPAQQQCVLPATFNIFKLMYSYYMVADNPSTGCQSEIVNYTAQTKESEACGDQIVAPWGNLFPVYSPKTGLLYKNERCAMCHGVSDWIRWNAILECERFDSSDNDHTWSIPEHIENLEFNHDVSYSHCLIRFQYPGAIADIKGAQCFDNAIDVCSERVEFDFKFNLSITEVDVAEACTGGLFSPFPFTRGWYKNVFCFMCNQKSKMTEKKLNRCRDAEEIMKRGNSLDHFVTLLDYSYIESLQKIRQDTDDRPLACEQDGKFLSRSNCRMLYCPSGQLYFPDGNCRFPSKHWYGETISILIKLNPENVINLSAFKAIYRDNIEDNREHVWKLNKKLINNNLKSKFLKNWRIHAMYQENYSTSLGESRLKKLFIGLLYKFSNKSPEEITKHAKTGLKEVWTLTLNKSSFQLMSEIAEYSTLTGDLLEGYRPLWSHRMHINHKSHIHISAPTLWEVFNTDPDATYTIITKMFFCKQIQLKSGEFVFDETKTLLYVNATDTFLFENEFVIVRDDSGIYVPRVCLHDSTFEQIDSFNNATENGSASVWYITVIALCLVVWQCFSV